jgi:hypothetical protein
MKRYVALFICLFSLSAAAQQKAAPPKAPNPPQAPAAPSAPAPPAVRAIETEDGQLLNIRVDVSVIDQSVTMAAQPKTLMVILADRRLGQTRAVYEDRSIFVDARPWVVDGLIRLSMTVKSEEPPRLLLPGAEAKGPNPILNWTNSFVLLLSNGKPMVALETSDAVTKRKLSIEVKATIQR